MLTGVVAAVLLCLAQATDRSDRAAAGRPNCLTYNAPYATFSPGFGNVNWDTLNKSVQSSINASLYACGEQCELAVVSRAPSLCSLRPLGVSSSPAAQSQAIRSWFVSTAATRAARNTHTRTSVVLAAT